VQVRDGHARENQLRCIVQDPLRAAELLAAHGKLREAAEALRGPPGAALEALSEEAAARLMGYLLCLGTAEDVQLVSSCSLLCHMICPLHRDLSMLTSFNP
jgi:hypothetical protein